MKPKDGPEKAALAIGICMLAGLLNVCHLFAKAPLVSLPANVAWSDDEKEILLIRYRFRPQNKNTPYFNAQEASDWQIQAEALGPDLQSRRLLLSWPCESRDGGGIMQRPVYWLRSQKRLIYTESQIPFLHLIDKKRRIELRPPEALIKKLVGPSLAPGVSGLSPIPSPDGKYIAIWFNTSYIRGGPLGPQIHTHFVSFFRTSDGRHLRSLLLPFSDKEFDPWILPEFLAARYHKSALPLRQAPDKASSETNKRPPRPPNFMGIHQTDNGFRYRFLWKKDASGIYVITKQESWFVPAAGKDGPERIQVAPAHALATRGGPVDSLGNYLVIEINKARPNATVLKKRHLRGWTAFAKNPLLPIGRVSYTRP